MPPKKKEEKVSPSPASPPVAPFMDAGETEPGELFQAVVGRRTSWVPERGAGHPTPPARNHVLDVLLLH